MIRSKVYNPLINDVILSLVIFFLPLSIKLTNISTIALVLSCAIQHIIERTSIINKTKTAWILINSSTFIFLFISFLVTKDWSAGVFAIEKFLPLIVFPLIVPLLKLKHNVDFFLRLFASTVLVMCIVCLINGSIHFFSNVDEEPILGDFFNAVNSKWRVFSNILLMRPFDISPIYMSLYVSFSMFIVALDIQMPRIVKFAMTVVLLTFQILIASRIGMTSFFIITLIVCATFVERRIRRYVLLIYGLVVIVFSVSILTNAVLKKRFINDFVSSTIPNDVTGWNALNIRAAIWSCSLKSFTQSPVIGYGIAAQGTVREECYKQYSFYGPFGTNLNSHNQYLEFALIGGIILAGLFLIQIGCSLREAIRNQSILHFAFISLFALTCLGESLLETHKGIVFFSLFNSFFSLTNRKQCSI